MYGKAQEVRQKERTLLWPRSPYGVAKAYGHHMTINCRDSYSLVSMMVQRNLANQKHLLKAVIRRG
jgi:GDP-D-mannose dehydratase